MEYLKNAVFIFALIIIGFSLNAYRAQAADRYWVGGGSSTNWNATGSTNWALTSGGANNAAVPTGTDVAIFDSASGSGTAVYNSGVTAPASITFNGFSGTFTQNTSLNKPITFASFTGIYNQNSTLTTTSVSFTGFAGTFNQNNSVIQGSSFDLTGFSGTFNQTNNSININSLNVANTVLKFSPSMIYNATGVNSVISINATNCAISSCTVSVTTAGKIMPHFTVNAKTNVTVSLQDDFTSSSSIEVYNGSFITNNHNITAAASEFVNLDGPIDLNLGSSVWTLTGADSDSLGSGYAWLFSNNNGTLTLNPGTSTIKFTDTSSNRKSFFADNIFNNVWFTGGGSGIYSIIASPNTFNDFRIDNPPHAIEFPSSASPTTVSSFTVSGTAGNLMTLSSDNPGNAFILSKSSGIIHADYLNITDSIVTGGATWYAGAHSIDSGNNTSWIFAPTLTIESSEAYATEATLHGTITATGGENASVRGFEYGVDTNYGSTTTESGSFGVGAYTRQITNLACNTTYHARAYATNGSGTHYSSDTTFTTLSCPVIRRNSIPPFIPGPAATANPGQVPSVSTTTATVETVPIIVPILSRILKLTSPFMRGNDVHYLQLYLNTVLNPPLPLEVDGIYGLKTRGAVIDFQKANGLAGDGVVGRLTWGKIKK